MGEEIHTACVPWRECNLKMDELRSDFRNAIQDISEVKTGITWIRWFMTVFGSFMTAVVAGGTIAYINYNFK